MKTPFTYLEHGYMTKKIFLGPFKNFFLGFFTFFWLFFDENSKFGQKSVFLTLFTTKYILIDMPYYHNFFSSVKNNVKGIFQKL